MRGLTLALALGLSGAALGGCSHSASNMPAASPPASPAAATPSPKPDSHMTMGSTTPMAQHERIAKCSAQATQQHLSGDATADFLNACVSGQNAGDMKMMQ